MVGPSKFGGWLPNGDPIGIENPVAWVQLTAVSQSQCRNTMLLLTQYVPKRTRLEYGMDIGKEKATARDGARQLEMLTTSFRSQEGARPTLVIANETHHWVSSVGGHDLYDVLERNLAKSKGGRARMLAITNAPQPNEDSICERTRSAYVKLKAAGLLEGSGIFYDSLEAPSEATLEPDVIRKVMKKIRGDSTWLDIESVVKSVIDPRNPPFRSRRFWYNQVWAEADTLVPSRLWDPVEIEGATLSKNDEIVLGFDGGITDDATVLMALRLSDRCLIPIKISEKPKASTEKYRVDMRAFDDAVAFAFSHYEVRAFFADVSGWESYVDKWSDDYRDQLLIKATPGKSSVGYDMRGHQEEITRNNERLVGAIRDQTIHHDGNPTVREHVMNTKKRINKFGMSFTKLHRESERKNDAYAASLLAFIAMSKYLESGKQPKKRSGRMWAF